MEWFDLEDESVMLPGGVEGRVRALSGDDALQVPTGALRRSGDGAVVLVRDNGNRREVVVQVLASAGASALVRGDSLRAGDEVVADIASVLAAEAEGD